MMRKVNKLETHDRLLEAQKQSEIITAALEEAIFRGRELFGGLPFYFFIHERTTDGQKEIYGQMRLSKPSLIDNSMLFKVGANGIMRSIWILPPKHRWSEYTKGKMLESKVVMESIHDYKNLREGLEGAEIGDLPDSKICEIYQDIEKAGISKISLFLKIPIQGMF